MLRFSLMALIVLSGCAHGGAAAAQAVENSGATTASLSSCPVIKSYNWAAWIDALPGPDAAPKLRVVGSVVLPTPGYESNWRLGPADRMQQPRQRLILSFTQPQGVVEQVVTTQDVRYEGEAIYPEYRAILVRCGDKTIAEITDIAAAH